MVNVSTNASGNLLVTAANNGGAAASYFTGAAAGVGSVTVTGSSDADRLNVDETNPGIPVLTFNAGLPNPPASPGDELNLTLTGVTNPTLNDTFSPASGYSGGWSFGNRKAVHFTGIETLNPNSGAIVVTVGAGNHTLVVNATNANSGTYSLDGGPAVSFMGATSFTFNGQAGAATTP